MRYEVPAVIVLDAHDARHAEAEARSLSEKINMESGPGAFFMQGVAVTGEASISHPDREGEAIANHVQRLMTDRREAP